MPYPVALRKLVLPKLWLERIQKEFGNIELKNMKYEILIEGGFIGIPKEYKGEIDVKDETKDVLLNVFNRNLIPENENLRDGLQYHLKLVDGSKEHRARFDETNLPLPIRQFIATISKTK